MQHLRETCNENVKLLSQNIYSQLCFLLILFCLFIHFGDGFECKLLNLLEEEKQMVE